jgi:energy-coupling factor transporter transmembrane protein EcfT
MGALFFMAFMAILFFIAVIFIFVSSIIIIIWNIQKRMGKSPKKWWLVVPTVLLIINVIVALLPVGYVGFLRYANRTLSRPVIYAESGKMLYWPMGEYEPTKNWFEMEGANYSRFRRGFADDPFYLDYGDDKLGEPVANIMNNPEDSNAFNDFMTKLFTGSKMNESTISTVYPVINDNGFEFYHINISANNAYCPEEQLDSIKAYYMDIANYDTLNVTCEYMVYAEAEGLAKRDAAPYNKIEKNITLRAGVFEELRSLLDSGQNPEHIEIPQKYRDIGEVPGTPLFGYEQRELKAYSQDRMAYRYVSLALIDGVVYAESSSGYDYINGYPLSDEITQYLIDTVFGA